MRSDATRTLAAEAFGTFVLVFAGTGAIVIDGVSEGAISHLGIALTFGLVVMAMIYALGDISGAHFNPAVTLAFWAARRFPVASIWPYVLSQCVGAIAASFTLRALIPVHATYGATLPAGSAGQSFVLEILLTLVLMFVILSAATGAKERGLIAGSVIGATVALEALFAGPISGASMNPARSLGPALASGELSTLWIYLAGPSLGALLAVPLCRLIHLPGCCDGACAPAVAPTAPAPLG